MNNLKLLWDRIKKIKHIEIYIALGVAVIVIAIYLSTLGAKSGQTGGDNIQQNSTLEFSSSAEYVDYLENKLNNVLSSVKGAGKTEVIITLASGFEYTYATEEETVQSSQGSVTTTKLVMVDGKPVVTEEHYPKIKGIVVISQGAQDVTVKMNLLSVIQTVIEVDNANIVILAGN